MSGTEYIRFNDKKSFITDKTVVFYNTGIGVFLHKKEIYLNKLRTVIESISRHENIILWWRPHPHLRKKLKSADVRLSQEYELIISDYVNSGKGIYDETEDLYRAVEAADIFYGDPGSVEEHFRNRGKPVVTQNADIPYAFSEYGFSFPLIMSVYEGNLYYMPMFRNILLMYDTNASAAKYINTVAEQPPFTENKAYHNYNSVIDGKIFLIPYKCSTITIYDICRKEYEIHQLSLRDEYLNTRNGYFYNFIIYGDLIYLLPDTYPFIVSYNMKTFETCHCLDLEVVYKDYKKSEHSYFFSYEYLDNERILLPMLSTPTVLEFNMRDCTYVLHEIYETDCNLAYITKHSGKYLVIAHNFPVFFMWDCKNFQKKTITPIGENLCINSEIYKYYFGRSNIIKYENYLFLFPSRANMVCRIDMDNCEVICLNEFDVYCKRDEVYDIAIFDGVVIYKRKILAWHYSGVLLEYDIKSRTINKHTNLFSFSDNDYLKLSHDFLCTAGNKRKRW